MNTDTNLLTISNYERNVFEVVAQVRSYISKNDCSCLEVDVSSLNLIDASKVILLGSTYHLVKYPQGTITWTVADRETERAVLPMKTDNAVLKIAGKTTSKVIYLNQKCQVCTH